ncbi:MAG: hypothetical protein V5A88_03180 [Candidatus Thermoplasmatota archaeon]
MNLLQWLQSKIVLIAVAIILVSSVTTFFYYQIGELEEEELETRGEKFAQIITDMQDSDVDEMSQTVTFDEEREGIYLDPMVGGDPYTIEIKTGLLILKQDGMDSIESLGPNVHLWDPGRMNDTGRLPPNEGEWRDEMFSSIELQAGERDLKLIMLNLYNGETYENHIFITEVPLD